MNTTAVRLKKRTRKLPSGETETAYQLVWNDASGARRFKALKPCDQMTQRDAEAARRAMELSFGKGEAKPEPVNAITIGKFIDVYKARRRQGDAGRGYLPGSPKLRESTITEHDMTLRYLSEHFGETKSMKAITTEGAEAWIEALAGGKLAGARTEMKRIYKVGEQTIRKHIRNAKAIFAWAEKNDMVMRSPFAKFRARPVRPNPNTYVPVESVEAVLQSDSTPAGWKALFALCRLGGLRVGEALSLPWAGTAIDRDGEKHRVGVDWENRRISLVAQKTSMFRTLPMSPRLHDVLLAVYDAAPEGGATACGLPGNNTTRDGQAMLRAVGVTPWPKLFQAMRSSCENDFKMRGVAEATYAEWMGHSIEVSRGGSYANATDQEYAMIAKPNT